MPRRVKRHLRCWGILLCDVPRKYCKTRFFMFIFKTSKEKQKAHLKKENKRLNLQRYTL